MLSLFLLFPWALLRVTAKDQIQGQVAPWFEPAWLFSSDTCENIKKTLKRDHMQLCIH